MGAAPAQRSEGGFAAFYSGPFRGELVKFERRRSAALRSVLTWGGLIVAAAIAIALGLAQIRSSPWVFLVSAVAALVGVMLVHHKFTADYFRDFKQQLVAPLVQAYDARLSYDPDGQIGRSEFEAAGMFRELEVSEYAAEDLVSGRFDATALRFCEVDAKNVRYTTDSKGRQERHETRILKGAFFSADFNKHFAGATYVRPDTAQRLLGALGQALQGMSRAYGELVKLEDPEFERLFAVYSSDQIEARYILSSALMQRIKQFRLRSGHRVHVAFVRSSVYVAIELNRAMFEARLFRSIADPAVFREFWDDLEPVAGIVEDLNLNTRIWTKS